MTNREKNNSEALSKFINKMRRWHGPSNKTIYVMDNVSYHRSPWIQHKINKSGTSILYLPPSSSDLNPIEHTWDHLKKEVNKRLFKIDPPSALKSVDYGAVVEAVLRDYARDKDSRKTARSVQRAMYLAAKGQLA